MLTRKKALQWGRNLTVAEGIEAERRDGDAKPLQWGRNLTVAEGLKSPAIGRGWIASMGPQLDSCGRQVTPYKWFHTRFASMGPQLDSCGRLAAARLAQTLNVKLQWGRNLTVAEGNGL